MANTHKLVLAIDASAPCSAVAVGRLGPAASRENSVFLSGDERIDGANQASQSLDVRIRDALTAAAVDIAAVDYIACGCGPGTFTGTRVALATAQGLASGLQCPAISLSTLEALAWSQPGLDELPEGSVVLALLDARRGEVYGRAYQRSGDRWGELGEARCCEITALLESLPDAPLYALGPGVEPYRDRLPAHAHTLNKPDQLMGPSAKGLWRAVCAAFDARGAHPVTDLRPVYLRATYAELGINKPKRPMYKSDFV